VHERPYQPSEKRGLRHSLQRIAMVMLWKLEDVSDADIIREMIDDATGVKPGVA
jgi:hypothetical protein